VSISNGGQAGQGLLQNGRRYRTKRKETKASSPENAESAMITTEELCVIKGEMSDNSHLILNKRTLILPPSFFVLFKNLRILDLRKAALERMPPQIMELTNLQELDVRENKFTCLPSQITRLPNLHRLQIKHVRNRQMGSDRRLLKYDKDVELISDHPCSLEKCSCLIRTDGERTPPLRTLAQLCTCILLRTIPNTISDDGEELAWRHLESYYSTGKFKDREDSILPFPSHLLPTFIPFDLCSHCLEPVLPIHAQFIKVQTVALTRVRLQYMFCSHKCFAKVTDVWKVEDRLAEEKRKWRHDRFSSEIQCI
jgi:hypothetical protein